ncbi:hypothetical protein N5079_19870 [Planotetraspora sp. A-T 1434]|uniref:hypothetical protein n=1 Tax=Planotetraspora sp. A-T 1434 TaxID=2979219 RepID=UPI0021BF77E6|nr:hypothetical protein [Planotetraspora sp. A-T 1434]MCT9932463.1 hypothetical protein [Planotetraspora sp. A-T 1434]
MSPVAPGTNIHPLMSPSRVVERFPVGQRVRLSEGLHGWPGTGERGTVTPCREESYTPGYAYGSILGLCAWVNVVWDSGRSEGVPPGHLQRVEQ